MLKQFAHIALVWTVTAAVAFATIGVPMHKMVCFMSGKTNVSVLHIDSCCPELERPASSTPVFVQKCCEVSCDYLAMEEDAVQTVQQFVPTFIAVAVLSCDNLIVPLRNASSVWQFADLPPPDLGAPTQAQIQVFIV